MKDLFLKKSGHEKEVFFTLFREKESGAKITVFLRLTRANKNTILHAAKALLKAEKKNKKLRIITALEA